MRCLPGSSGSRTARWLFYSHTSPRGGDTHTRLNSSGVIGPRAWSLPPAHRPGLACRDTQRGAWGGENPQYTQFKPKKEISLSDEAMLPAERKRSGTAGMQGMRATTTSSNSLVLRLRGLRLLDPLLLPEVWLFPWAEQKIPPPDSSESSWPAPRQLHLLFIPRRRD